jgi:putative sigma-54 modulation protein
MKIEFTGRQTEIPDDVRRLAERKLLKLGKLSPKVTHAHVILTADKHRQVSAEVSLHSRQLDLAAVEVSTNPRLSVARAFDKLLRQVERQRSKRYLRKGASSPRLPEPAPAEPGAVAPGPRVIRARRRAVKPMTLDEATLEMDGSADGVLVFRDAATERVTVLFRRRDGNLGLIEPEA